MHTIELRLGGKFQYSVLSQRYDSFTAAVASDALHVFITLNCNAIFVIVVHSTSDS